MTAADRAYSNARRSGRTKPDLVEVIGRDDKRHWSNRGRNQGRPNRAERRAAGFTPGHFRNPARSPRVVQSLHPLSADARLLARLRKAFAEMAA